MHYREVSTLNNLRSAAFALQIPAPSADGFARSASVGSQIPPVTLRSARQGPFWIKASLVDPEDTGLQRVGADAVAQNGGLGGFRIGGLTVHALGSFDLAESAYSETGLANDVDLEACYDVDFDRPMMELNTLDRVLALPLGFKCSRTVFLERRHPCTATAEIVQCQRQSDSLTPDAPGISTQTKADDLEIAWKITLVFSQNGSYGSLHDREFFSGSMKGTT